jgi:HEAT repeat protein
MPRETLRALDADVERLLLAGGAMAGADDGLIARRDALVKLGEKVPALAKIAEQVAKVLGQKPRAAAAELLSLSAVVTQLRGAQAQPGQAGEAAPLEPKPPLETPLAPQELEALLKALRGDSKARAETIDDAVERKAVRDLRLLGPWLAALADPNIGDEVAAGIAQFGEAALAPLKAAYDLKGGQTDVRRLRCLMALIPEADIKPLLLEAVEKGSTDLRAGALEMLASYYPADAEPLALSMLKEKDGEIRAAAAEALAKSESEAAFAALLGAMGDRNNRVQRAISEALSKSQHPEATARLIALLTPEALDFEEPKAPKKSKKKLTPAQQKALEKEQEKLAAEIQRKVDAVSAVTLILRARKDPAAAPPLLAIWRDHKHSDVREAAGEALIGIGEPASLEAMTNALGDPKHEDDSQLIEALFALDARAAYEKAAPYFAPEKLAQKKRFWVVGEVMDRIAWSYGEDEITKHLAGEPRWLDIFLRLLTDKHLSYEAGEALGEALDAGALGAAAAYERLSPYFAPEKIATKDGAEAAEQLASTLSERTPKEQGFEFDPRWNDLFVGLLSHKGLKEHALDLLVERKDPRAVEPLLANLKKDYDYQSVERLIEYKEPRLMPALLALLEKADKSMRPTIYENLKTLDDPAAVPALTALQGNKKKKLGKDEASQLKDLIEHLSRPR